MWCALWLRGGAEWRTMPKVWLSLAAQTGLMHREMTRVETQEDLPSARLAETEQGWPKRRQAATFRVVRWLVPRLLALIYLVAFWSWGSQYDGLVGSQGVLPVERQVEMIQQNAQMAGIGSGRLFFHFPTLFLWHQSDSFGHGICWAGGVVALLAAAGFLQGPLLLVLSFLYLSLANGGSVFMGFQWDVLLVEAGFVVAWFAPWHWWTGRSGSGRRDGSRLALFLLHFLIFKLMFMSGYVKPSSGDETWLNATALTVHYETQPLPSPLAWWVHHWPHYWHVASCWGMYFIELVLPFAIFCGRWGRLSACLGFCGLMVTILLTGNYTYFNYLTIVLSLSLVDDGWWPRRLRKWLGEATVLPPRHPPRWHWSWLVPISASWLFLSLVVMALDTESRSQHPKRPAWAKNVGQHITNSLPQWMRSTYQAVNPFNIANSYGLFADMTTERYELSLEVSRDGAEWLEVPFKAKPGDPSARPHFVAPHQPRLDWQMWFAAPHENFIPERDFNHPSNFWVLPFCEALLKHQAPVWGLLGSSPIPPNEVKYVRFQRYRYSFTAADEHRESGLWWKRESLGPWTANFSLKE